MRIPLRYQSNQSTYAFIMEFELDNMSAYSTDTSNLRIQATFRRVGGGDSHLQALYPILLELHGKLVRANGQGDGGAVLGPVRELPISFEKADGERWFDLLFTFPLSYLQTLEEERKEQDIRLLLEMWGVVAMVHPRNVEPRNKSQVNPALGMPSPIEVVWFERIETDRSNQNTLTIPRSTWIDRILPGLGYGRSVLIELPLLRTPPLPEAYKNAVKALANAQNAFSQDDYRSAVKYGREVTEYLQNSCSGDSKSITSFCSEFLEPVIGESKSKAVEAALNGTRRITSPGSHANTFLVDRVTAAYLIETLALNLRYISAVLH